MASESISAAPRIAIVGGGPSGLTLLNVLARHGISATLYERDDNATSRAHLGGMLDLHEDSGQLAMRGAGLWDAFLQHARAEGEELIVTDRTGEPIFHHKPPPEAANPARPEIDRRDLRRVLVDGAPAGSIQWGYAFVSAAPVAGTHAWALTFANGHTATADLVVGADGGRSRVRPLISDAQVSYTGYQIAETYFDAGVHPELAARVGAGSHFGFDEHKFLAAQHNGDGRVRVYCFFRAPEDFALPANAISGVLAQIEGWAAWQREMVRSADPASVVLRPLHILPVGHAWPHRRGVTLVGDAMNLMSTFAAKGANMALWDALQLGEAIANSGARDLDALDEAVAQYEQHACEVAGKWAALSARNMGKCLGDNGARAFADHFIERFGESGK